MGNKWIRSVVAFVLMLPLIVRILVSIDWSGEWFLVIMDVIYIILFIIGLTMVFIKLRTDSRSRGRGRR